MMTSEGRATLLLGSAFLRDAMKAAAEFEATADRVRATMGVSTEEATERVAAFVEECSARGERWRP